MPVVNSGNNSLQMADPFSHSLMLSSTAFGSTSSTQFQTQNGGLIWTFTGSGFSGGAIPTSGTITGISVSGGASVTGISYSVATLRAGPEVGVMLAAIFAGNDTVNGGAFGDALTGYGGTNVLNGGDGEDLLQSLGTGDTLDGGSGLDIVYLERTSGLGVTLNLAGMETNTGITLSDGTIIRNIERFNITTGSGADVLSFSGDISGSNVFNAGGGTDRIVIDISGSSLPWYQQYDRIVDQSGSNVAFLFSVEEFYITTGSGSDTLQGGSGNDRFIAGAGDDFISSGGGVDYIDGGDGIDKLTIDRSATTIAITLDTADMASATGVTFGDGAVIRNIERFDFVSGSGNDTFIVSVNPAPGVNGQNNINGGAGNDTLTANFAGLTTSLNLTWTNIETVHATTGSGADTLYGGSGNDELRAGAGNDILSSGLGGVDLLDGEDGVDTAYVDMSWMTSAISVVFADFATSSGVTFANGTIVRNVEIVNFTASAANDVLNLGASIGNGHSFNGGGGLDTVTGDFSSSNVSISVQADGQTSWGSNYMLLNVERLDFTGSSAGDALFASTTSNADDILNGGGGSDTLAGYGGADILNGGGGDDNIYMHSGADQIDGGSGTDRLVYRVDDSQLNVAQIFNMAAFANMTTAGGVTLANGAVIRNMETIEAELSDANDTVLISSSAFLPGSFKGRNGFDTIDLNFASETRSIQLQHQIFSWSYLNFDGNWSNFAFIDFERVLLTAGSGNDTIYGLSGNDVISGGQGNDNLYGGSGADTINGDDGNDVIQGFHPFIAGGSPASDGADTLRGGAGDDLLIGGLFGDVLDGGAGYDTASYETGLIAVVVNLAAPNTNTEDAAGDSYISIERVIGSTFGDTITGDSAANALLGGDGNDTLNGGDGDDELIGGTGADVMSGGDGNDTIYADAADNLASIQGGAGDDLFVFSMTSAPTSFDLAAHGFERVEQRITDTGFNPWSTQFTLYDTQWRADFNRVVYDTGASSEFDWDQLNAFNWATNWVQYDALHRVDLTTTVFDNGVTAAYDYDQASSENWVSNWNQYNASSALDINETVFDNGTTTSMDFDSDNAFNWTSNWLQHDAGGLLDLNETVFDNGVTSSYDYDQADVFVWSSNWNQYAPGGALDINVTVFDDGTSNSNDFDQANAFNWTSNFNAYVVGGAIDYTITEFDNGERTVLDYDQANAFTWATIWQLYDSNGVLIGYQGVNDDGSLFGGP